jgi:hypothetical protein
MVRRADDAELKRALSTKTLKGVLPEAGPTVVDIRHSAYVDGLGDEALKVFVILSDDTKSAQLRWDKLGPIRQAIHDAIRCANDERYPYVRFLTRQEYRETRA